MKHDEMKRCENRLIINSVYSRDLYFGFILQYTYSMLHKFMFELYIYYNIYLKKHIPLSAI